MTKPSHRLKAHCAAPKACWLPVLLVMLAQAAHAQPPETKGLATNPKQAAVPVAATPPLDLSSPAAALSSFRQALKSLDLRRAVACVAGAKWDAQLEQYEQMAKQAKGFLADTLAQVSLAAETQFAVNGDKAVGTQQLTFVRENADWKIVGVTPEGGNPKNMDIGTLAYMLAHPEWMIQGRGRAVESTCLSNLKQLSLGAFQLAQDSDEKFAITRMAKLQPKAEGNDPRNQVAASMAGILAYVRSTRIFACPGGDQIANAYSFNTALDDVAIAEIPLPAQTVLFYEGKDRNLDFRHNGKTAVAFADGHCVMVSPEDAKQLIWAVK